MTVKTKLVITKCIVFPIYFITIPIFFIAYGLKGIIENGKIFIEFGKEESRSEVEE